MTWEIREMLIKAFRQMCCFWEARLLMERRYEEIKM